MPIYSNTRNHHFFKYFLCPSEVSYQNAIAKLTTRLHISSGWYPNFFFTHHRLSNQVSEQRINNYGKGINIQPIYFGNLERGGTPSVNVQMFPLQEIWFLPFFWSDYLDLFRPNL